MSRFLFRSGRGVIGLLIVLSTVLGLSACAGLSKHEIAQRPVETALPVSGETAFGALVTRQSGVEGGLSGFRLLSEGSVALDARLSMIRGAQRSLDLQTFELADDELGRLILRALREAAGRGVRVRLLLDDFRLS